MTEVNDGEKKMNFLLNKQPSQKEEPSDVATGGSRSSMATKPNAGIKRRVIVRKKVALEKEVDKKTSGSNESPKVRVVTSRSKVQASSSSEVLEQNNSSTDETFNNALTKEVKKPSLQEDVAITEVKSEKASNEVSEPVLSVGEELELSKNKEERISEAPKNVEEKRDVEKNISSEVKKDGLVTSKQPIEKSSKSYVSPIVKRSEVVQDVAPVKKYVSIDELNKRPNIKAGNLSDNAKKYRFNGNKKSQDGKTADGRYGDRRGGQFDRNKKDFSGQRNGDGKRFGNQEHGERQDRFGRNQNNNNRKLFSSNMSRPVPQPIPLETNKPSKKLRTVKKNEYSRKSKEEEFFEEKQIQQKKKVKDKVSAVPSEIHILESISVAELAKKMNLRSSEIIGKLMENGMMVTVNQSIDSDTAQIIASDYDCNVKVVSLYDETIIESASDEGVVLKQRPPIVTVMGHVDHGKTKTLDAIRSANVAGGEFGGITQHIGAYTVSYNGKPITFLDTPGHEAFTMMRARGAAITDIVVLVVAADDGVMPQTIEAINHAKDAKVPIIVAINKIDKPEANPDKVKNRLSELDLMPEDWGGKTMYVEISALKKQGIDDLLEAILLQAEVLELKANYDCNAEGKVVESKIDHGRGVVATIIVQRGILHEGDPYVAGVYAGHVRAIFNDRGERIQEALPSMPVEMLGLDEMPNAGDPFQVTDSEKLAKQISDKRRELKRFEVAQSLKKVTLDNLYETIQEGGILELKVIIKADVQGSVEALKQSLEKLSTQEVRLNVIHASAGAINESDVSLATTDSNVIIIGYNVRPTVKAKLLAETEKVDIRKYTVIYQAVEEMKLAMEGMLSPDKKEVVIANAEIRNVFKVSKIGNIAGIYVLDGTIKRSCLVNVIRENVVLASSLKISSLKRFKDDVKEVASGFECGLALENFNDVAVGDTLEFIEIQEVARKLTPKKEE
ncbi:MAG: translation initiation factor IF-2 [Treponema sp.]